MPRIYEHRVKGRSKLLIKALKICGGTSRLAARLGIERSAVSQWNTVPKSRLRQIKAITNGR